MSSTTSHALVCGRTGSFCDTSMSSSDSITDLRLPSSSKSVEQVERLVEVVEICPRLQTMHIYIDSYKSTLDEFSVIMNGFAGLKRSVTISSCLELYGFETRQLRTAKVLKHREAIEGISGRVTEVGYFISRF